MSSLRVPPIKRPRAPLPVKSTLRHPSLEELKAAASDPAGEVQPAEKTQGTTTVTSPTPESNQNIKLHPKGHRTTTLQEIWGLMDDTFLRNTDTSKLMDVWSYPVAVEASESSNLYVNVEFRQFVVSYHIKERTVTHKMNVDDVLKMFYLAAQIELDCAAEPRIDFDTWLAESIYLFSKEKGTEKSNSRPKLAEFLMNEGHVSIHPIPGNPKLHTVFRKVNVHSYKSDAAKYLNEFCLKCQVAKGKYEYIIEAKIAALPVDSAEVPETQKLD